SILSFLFAPEDPGAVLAALTDPRIRIVTLTIPEKAYLRAADGTLDKAHPDIVHDLANPGSPKTAHGFLAEALARRAETIDAGEAKWLAERLGRQVPGLPVGLEVGGRVGGSNDPGQP
ncbi:hypothetical protein EN810_35475, partial [Mesorhizobium sp. M8A.F.Ca.ET.167.01.1.1]